MYDILIKNGLYPDFQKMELVKGDIALRDGKIAAIGQVCEDAKTVIDAEGRIVSPGFIDIHMHEENFATEGHEYFVANLMLQMGVTTALGGNCGDTRQDLKDFLAVLEELGGSPINYMMMSGYNSFRKQLGINRYDPSTPEHIETMIGRVKEELAQGAVGVSFGLEYDPGIPYDEVMKVLDAIPEDDLLVSTHFREDSMDGVNEMIKIAVESGKKFQISHLSSCAAIGFMKEALEAINEASKKNPKLNYDTYPYAAFSTRIGSAVFDEGWREKWNKSYEHIFMPAGKYANQFCTEETYWDIRNNDPDLYVVAMTMNEDEIAASIANTESGMVASDGTVKAHAGHPRAAGTFPRVLGKYVREDKVISMIDALKKITLTPADRLGLSNKGRIEVGCDADITIFDPETIADGATFEQLNIKPVGIDAVIVDGKIALNNGDIVNDRLGRFIPGPYVK